MDSRAWWATVHGVKKLDTPEHTADRKVKMKVLSHSVVFYSL